MKRFSLILNIILISIILAAVFALYKFGIIPPFSSTYVPNENNQSTEIPKDIKTEIIASDLEIPWAIVFIDEDTLLVSERTGKIKLIENKEVNGIALDLTSQVVSIGEAGLMSMVKDPDFDVNKFIYIYHTYRTENGATQLKVARYTFESGSLVNEIILIRDIPSGSVHSGGEIAFGPDGKLYITTGDVASAELAQDMTSLAGKTLRINKDGTIPQDNPFVELARVALVQNGVIRTEIWSLGHRNAQGLDWHPITQEMYQSEHGPSGFDGGTGMDEINFVRRGLNYGWPTIRGNETSVEFESPLISYSPAIAPASVAFYEGAMFSELENVLLVGALRGQSLKALKVNGSQIEELGNLIDNSFGRIREVAVAPDGSIYFTTSNRDGRGAVQEGDDKIIRIYR